jgi:hypothetical protein
MNNREQLTFILPHSLRMLILMCVVFLTTSASAQWGVPELPALDTAKNGRSADTLANSLDSLSNLDTSTSKNRDLGVRISKDAPEHKIYSKAKDSAIFDMETNMFYLYGDVAINQDDLDLKGGVVAFDQKNNVVSAYPTYDTAGKQISEQTFTQGSETFVYDSLRYNFKSKRALVRNARMQYGEAYINSYQVKRNPDQSIYGYLNLYSTCNLPHPHFGIHAKKIKVIPNKVAASGWVNLTIADLPTPLVFPFGVFPINPEQKSGFILPTYTLEGNRGMGLQKLGYYANINKYIGASVQFDIFSKGSFGVFGSTEYNVRYRYSGAFNFDYTLSKLGEEFEQGSVTQKDFKVRWRHTVDSRAMPGASFSANVDFGTGGFNRVNGMTAEVQTNNQYNSNIAYTKSWAGKPYNFSAALRHNQSTQTGQVTVTLPEFSFNVAQITPFQSKNRIGKAKWFEKISASYNLAGQNRYRFIDSNFSFNRIDFRDMDNGLKHSVSLGATYNVLRFINWNFSVPYNEYWNTKQSIRSYNPNRLTDDTTIRNGFFASRDFSVTSSLSTRIYGLKTFKKGKVMGIRHVINPSLNFNYTPGFARAPYNYMYDYYNQTGIQSYLSYYELSPENIGGPRNAIPNGSAGISINNNLQMKVRTKDSVGTKNITLLDGFAISTNYNFFADSNNLSNIAFSGRTSILNKFNISFGGSFDPYHYEDGRRTKYYATEMGGPIAKMRNFNVALDFNLAGTAGEDSEDIENQRKNSEEFQRMLVNNGMHDYYDFNVPWNLNIRSSLNYSLVARKGLPDTAYVTPNLSLMGSLRFTPKLMFNFSTGYDFINKQLGSTTFNVTRDLHCWQMMLNVTPFGLYRNYNFTLNVKSSVLQDLKLTRRKAYQDNF